MSVATYGEQLFDEYLNVHGVKYEREPDLPGIPERIDVIIDHPTCGKILLDVKDIENEPPGLGYGAFDLYRPIRTHIDAGRKKFRNCADYLCGLVLAAPPTSFVTLSEPTTIMGAMHGNIGWQLPVNVETGTSDPDARRTTYMPGQGKMIRRTQVQNTRIAALVIINKYSVWHAAMRKYMNTDDGRDRKERYVEIMQGEVDLPDYDVNISGVTVWENAVASRKLPKDLFRGETDTWWEVIDGCQVPTFIGARRKELEIDKDALEPMGFWPLPD
jgi:hypothetical protein